MEIFHEHLIWGLRSHPLVASCRKVHLPEQLQAVMVREWLGLGIFVQKPLNTIYLQ